MRVAAGNTIHPMWLTVWRCVWRTSRVLPLEPGSGRKQLRVTAWMIRFGSNGSAFLMGRDPNAAAFTPDSKIGCRYVSLLHFCLRLH